MELRADMVAVEKREYIYIYLYLLHISLLFGRLTFLINYMGKCEKIQLNKSLVLKMTADHFMDIFV
jgi:hypothetical protein